VTASAARASIQAFAAGNRSAELAQTALGSLPGASGSMRFMCSGGRIFVAKGTKNQKSIIAEHVVARLGQLIEAPVGEVALVDIPAALRVDPTVAAMGAGLAHATLFIENITDKIGIANIDVPENRARFARLCGLYSLCGAGDPQLFYSTISPQVVYSLDHGHFFPQGPGWSAASLAAAPPALIDPYFAGANLSSAELADARNRLSTVSDQDIADIIAGPPPDWPFTDQERAALGTYLRTRRDTLLTVLPQA
jgi:hypothetical protein